jgi:hypothetical protein
MMSAGIVRGLHRRLGLVLGPAVLLWFLSGLVLLWVPYPGLAEREWFTTAEAIRLQDCCAALDRLLQQLDRSDGIESVRIRMVGGRPVATAQFLNGAMAAVTADEAARIAPLPRDWARRAALQFAPGTSVEDMNLIDHDVWTVHQRFDPYRPLWKVQLSGQSRSVLYVSSVTGDVVQDTTAEERRWNLVGALIHWWYWPWLRRHWAWWDQIVWWVSAAGTATLFAGVLILGREWSKQNRTGLMTGRWKIHRGLGVIAGASACCWMASGWLSMDHGRWFSDGQINADDREQFMGGRLMPRDIEAMPDLSTVPVRRDVKEILVIKMAGIVHLIVRESPSQQQVLAVTSPVEDLREGFQDELVKAASRSLLGDGVLTVTKLVGNDAGICSGTGGETASPLIRVETIEHDARGVQVDGGTGALVERVDLSRRLYHRLFNTFHRWDVPWFSQHCDFRRVLMSAWCVLGAGLAGSGMWLGLVRSGVKPLHR